MQTLKEFADILCVPLKQSVFTKELIEAQKSKNVESIKFAIVNSDLHFYIEETQKNAQQN